MPQRSLTEVELDGEKALFYRVMDMRWLERTLGESVEVAIQQRGASRLSTFILAGLRYKDAKMTTEQADNLIDAQLNKGGSYVELWAKVFEALQNCGWIPREAASSNGGPPTTAEPAPSPGATKRSVTGSTS